MKRLETEQLTFDDLADGFSDEEQEKIVETGFSVKDTEPIPEDCKVCGDSGPCSVCSRGISLAKEQGYTYRRRKKSVR